MISRLSNFVGPLGSFFSGGVQPNLLLSLDSFNTYGEKTLENIWSFDEVINLELILLITLLILSQIPFFILLNVSNEKEKNILPEFWKPLSFIVFIISGLLTPTIDGYTQLSFAFSSLSLYVIIITILGKRIDIKFNTTKGLSF
jgi:Sec-independent protein secretion pathway component TatC